MVLSPAAGHAPERQEPRYGCMGARWWVRAAAAAATAAAAASSAAEDDDVRKVLLCERCVEDLMSGLVCKHRNAPPPPPPARGARSGSNKGASIGARKPMYGSFCTGPEPVMLVMRALFGGRCPLQSFGIPNQRTGLMMCASTSLQGE